MCLNSITKTEVGEIVAYKVFSKPNSRLRGVYFGPNGDNPCFDKHCYVPGKKYVAHRVSIPTFDGWLNKDESYITGFHAYIKMKDAEKYILDNPNTLSDCVVQKVKLSGELSFGDQGPLPSVCGEFMEILE